MPYHDQACANTEKYIRTGDPTGLFPERKSFSLLEVGQEWTQLKHKTLILPLTKISNFYLLLVCICVYVTEREGGKEGEMNGA